MRDHNSVRVHGTGHNFPVMPVAGRYLVVHLGVTVVGVKFSHHLRRGRRPHEVAACARGETSLRNKRPVVHEH